VLTIIRMCTFQLEVHMHSERGFWSALAVYVAMSTCIFLALFWAALW
jgi:hypothetical protein